MPTNTSSKSESGEVSLSYLSQRRCRTCRRKRRCCLVRIHGNNHVGNPISHHTRYFASLYFAFASPPTTLASSMDPLVALPAASALVGIESTAKWNKPSRKMRSACDRCHSQKLRCTRKQGEVGCQRCLRLHTSCRFGPRAPRASPKVLQGAAQDDRHEPSSDSVAITIPNLYSNLAITDGGTSEWLFTSDVDQGVAEEQGVTSIADSIHLPSPYEASQDDITPVARMLPELCYPVPEDLADMHCFWPNPPCEPVNMNPLEQYGSLDVINQERFCDSFPSPDTSSSHSKAATSPALTIRNLANLNIALYDCAAKLPSISEGDERTARIASHGGSAQAKKLFVFDELFHLTSEFINVIKCFSCVACDSSIIPPPTANPKPSSTTAAQSPLTSNQPIWHTDPIIATTTDSRKPEISHMHLDEGTLLMIMSCHYRLTDMYISIFQMMQACLKFPVTPSRDNDKDNAWAIVLPQYQVGSFAIPSVHVDADGTSPSPPLSSSTASMYMVMITMLSSQLCETLAGMMRMGDVGQNVGGGGGGGGGDRGGNSPLRGRKGVGDRPFFMATITDRTNRLRRTIDTTKQLLQRSSIVVV